MLHKQDCFQVHTKKSFLEFHKTTPEQFNDLEYIITLQQFLLMLDLTAITVNL